MSYQQMASLYDQFMNDAPYDKWVKFTEEIIQKYHELSPKIIDLGCGTGEVTIELAKRGYLLSGVDYATDMLAIAEQKANSENLSIRWFHQDLRDLQGFHDYDVAISYCDVINYITTKEELHSVFSHVAHALKENGLFIFDVHSMAHVEHDLVGNTFSEVTENSAYIWECYPGEDEGEMFHELTFFSETGGHYTRFDETHHQKTYPVDVYHDLLKNCGFEILDICADFSFKSGFSGEEAERIFIIAQKRTR